MSGEYGIKETKEVTVATVGLANAVVQARANGRWDVGDIGFFIGPITKIPDAVEGAGDIKNEIPDMDEAELAEIVDELKKLDLPDDEMEEIIEDAGEIGFRLGRLVTRIAKYRESQG